MTTKVYEENFRDPQITAGEEANANAMKAEEKANLDLIPRGFRQDNKQQLEDIKGEITKTNERLDEAEERTMKVEERVQNTEQKYKGPPLLDKGRGFPHRLE